MPKTLWNDDDRRALRERLSHLRADTPATWGSMNAGRMVTHLTDTMRLSTGDLAVAPKGGPLSLPVLKTLVMFHLPWPKGVPTAPELLARAPDALDAELARFDDALAAFLARPRDGAWPAHPAFGRLSGTQWGRLAHRHIAHHLTQFGL